MMRERRKSDGREGGAHTFMLVDGAIIMVKTLGDPSELERQVLVYRSLIRLAFSRG